MFSFFWIIFFWYVLCKNIRDANLARAGTPIKTHILFVNSPMTYGRPNFVWRCTQKKILLLLVSKGSKLSLAAVPSSKGSSTGSVCVKVVYEFACCLCATCPLLSHHSVFSIAAVCCSDCDIFSSTFVVRTPQYRPTQLLLMKDSRHKFLQHSLLSH